MNIITNFNPALAMTGTFNVVFPGDQGKMLVYNESNVNLQLTFTNGYTTYVPAWTAMLYCINGLPSPVVTWSVYSQLTAASAPISQVVIEGFDPNEPVPGTYPAALVRQTNIGNSVTTNVGSTTTLVNDGSANGTQIIEATPLTAGSSTISIDNAGNTTIKGNNAGVLTTLLQLIAGASPAVKLAAAAVLTEALGNMKVDGTLESVGAATLDSTLAVTGNSTLSGTLTVTGDATLNGSGTGLTVTNNALISGNETVSGTLSVSGDATFSGAGTGVSVAHNLGVTGTSSLDNGNLTTDGSGNVLWGGKLGTNTAGDRFDASTGASTYVKCLSGGAINFQSPNGTTVANIDSSGFLNLVHSLNLVVGSIGQLSTFNGTGNQTVATGVTNPTAIAFDPCTVSGSSQTIGGTVASSSVVTTGAGLAWRGTAWHA